MDLQCKLAAFENYLVEEEKSRATIEKYMRDVSAIVAFGGEETLSKAMVIRYKKFIAEKYAAASVNSMLVSVNAFLKFIGRSDCCVKQLKIQRQIFANEKKELTVSEYNRLLAAADSARLRVLMQTICETGIRISELRFITVENVCKGKAVVLCKNKTRVIFIPSSLKKILLKYIKKAGISTGSVFVTKTGKPLDRSNIWRDMKALCAKANVNTEKVFPHNLRHLFARTFYSLKRDIVHLADILGHSSVDTTRIYTMETGKSHIAHLEKIHRCLTT